MAIFSRGFGGRDRPARDPRLPPGQYDTGADWPVLTAEVTPHLAVERWTFTIDGLVDAPRTWSWPEIQALPMSVYEGDIHCVTTWSLLGTRFRGVSMDALFEQLTIDPAAAFVLVTSTTGYTTNMRLSDVIGGRAWLVWEHDGKPLSRDHGGPVRMIVPHLYFWKSAKWATKLTVLRVDQQGFWERNGYHDVGDPWLEQRYQGD